MPGAPLGPALRRTRISSARTSRSGSSMRLVMSSTESNTTARPVWRRSSGDAADCLMMAPSGARLPRRTAVAPPLFKGLSRVRMIRTRDNPLKSGGTTAVLRGNLAPDGAIIKQSAASPELLRHTGRAVVFDSVEDMTNRIDDPDLDVRADDILVLRNAGPKGAPGMPEAGYLPIPRKLARQGVKDMVRISDARMSGTAFGTIVLHIAPEAAVGGPIGLVRDGDTISLDVEARRLDLDVAEDELARRRADFAPPPHMAGPQRGYRGLYLAEVNQAGKGCDFDFLRKDGEI